MRLRPQRGCHIGVAVENYKDIPLLSTLCVISFLHLDKGADGMPINGHCAGLDRPANPDERRAPRAPFGMQE